MRKMTELNIAPANAAAYLDNEETIAEYLKAALENPASARRFGPQCNIARGSRENFYKATRLDAFHLQEAADFVDFLASKTPPPR